MGVSLSLQSYLGDHHVAYDVTKHNRTGNSSRTAEASHVPGERLAKGVVLKSGGNYILAVLAVLAASRHIAMEAVEKVTGAPVMLASEAEASMPSCSRFAKRRTAGSRMLSPMKPMFTATTPGTLPATGWCGANRAAMRSVPPAGTTKPFPHSMKPTISCAGR